MHFQYKIDHGAKWVLIFHHDLEKSGSYMTVDEAKFCDKGEKYSILSELSIFAQYMNAYEFLLEYPSYDYLQWRQTVNPVKQIETDTDLKSLGVQIIHNPYFDNFRGLALSISELSYLDGDARKLEDFWYSIGTFDYGNKIPGPFVDNIGYYVSECTLWLRIPWNASSFVIFNFGKSLILISLLFLM